MKQIQEPEVKVVKMEKIDIVTSSTGDTPKSTIFTLESLTNEGRAW